MRDTVHRRWKRPLAVSIAVVAALVVAVLAFVLCPVQPRPRPNLLLISIDTLRADHLGSYGYPVDTSPVLDALARDRGILFETVVAAAPSTTPSHASIFTSLLPVHHGAFFSRRAPLAPQRLTMAEILKDDGYRTASVNDGGQLDTVWGLSQGFDDYITLPGVSIKAKFSRNVKRVLAWLDENNQDRRPWFMFLHTYETHHPYNPGPEFFEAIGHRYSGDLPDNIDKSLLQEINEGRLEIDEEDRRHIVAAYDAEIRSMDAALGVLLRGLEERNLMDNTVIVLTSDHGEELGEHGMMGWHSHALWDEQLLVPLIIALPDRSKAGTRIADQVRGIDLLPTILELLSIRADTQAEGRSVMPLVRGERDGPRPAVSQRDTVLTPTPCALRTGKFKLYLREGEENPLLLCPEDDPGESSDLFEKNEIEATRLGAQLDELIGARPIAPMVTPVTLEGATEEQLRSLGYILLRDAGVPERRDAGHDGGDE